MRCWDLVDTVRRQASNKPWGGYAGASIMDYRGGFRGWRTDFLGPGPRSNGIGGRPNNQFCERVRW